MTVQLQMANSPAVRRSRTMPINSQRRLTFSVLLIPSMIIIGLINAYPVIFAAIQAVQNGTLISTGDFVGFDNFTHVLTNKAFWAATRFTLIFVLVGIFGSFIVGFSLALILRSGVPFARIFRVLFLLPWVVPVVVTATSWIWMMSTPTSFLPSLFAWMGLGQIGFLSDPNWAQVTVCLFKVWGSFPFCMLMMSSALASVDTSVGEAARVDGASRWQELIYVTVPMIARPIYVCWILMAIFCVNDFASVYLLTAGGPVNSTTTLVVYAYRLAFQNNQIGYGVAVAFLMTAALTVVSVFLYRKIQKVGNIA